MGSFDCYCALCAGPLNIGVINFGSGKSEALKKRRKQVAKQIRAQKRFSSAGNDTEDEDMSEEGEDVDDADEKVDVKAPEIPNPFAKQEEPRGGDDAGSDLDFEADDDFPASLSNSESVPNTGSDIYPGGVADVRQRTSSPDPRSLRDPDSWSQCSEVSIREDLSSYESESDDDNESLDSYEESCSYDPEKVQAKEIRWIDRCRCLSFNPDAPGITKAYISGRGRYNDYGGFEILKPGRDPNDNGEEELTCFHAYNPDETASYPFHEECYRILARVFGHEKYQAIDKDVLYGVMTAHADDRILKLPYGDVSGQEQTWQCVPGEEYSVCDPGLRVGFEDVLQSMLRRRLVGRNSHLPDLSPKVRQDPFRVMSYDILLNLFEHVDTNDMLALVSASTHIFETTRNTTFWKRMLRLRILPWFWELRKLLEKSPLPENFEYKGLFIWVNHVTTPEYGIEGSFMGIANRRRIWNSCKTLAPMYKQQVTPTSQAEPEDEEAKAILDGAESFHMPIVLYPLPKGATTVSAQFIRSWHEIAHRSCNFDTYWNEYGALIGIAVTFGVSQRVFGRMDGKRGAPLHIDAHEWIQEIRVLLGNSNMFDESIDRSHYRSALDARASKSGESHIEGMEIVLTSGRSEVVKTGGRNTRPFVVLPDMYLIGLTGQIAPNGVISRFGLLQSHYPEHNPRSPRPSYTPAQTTLWDPSALHLYTGPTFQHRTPIWHNSFYRVHTFTTGPTYDSGDLPSAMLPHQILLWSETPSQNAYMRRISTFSIEAGFCSSGTDRWPIPDLMGFASFRVGAEHAAQHIGTFGPVPSQSPEWEDTGYIQNRLDADGKPLPPLNPSSLSLSSHFHSYDEKYMQHFDVDGPAGEEIVQVDVSTDFKAIKLKTNKGRDCYWGEERRGQWYTRVASDEECIVGLSVCFGRLGGWSWKAKMYSHWKVSEIGIVVCRRDGAMWVE